MDERDIDVCLEAISPVRGQRCNRMLWKLYLVYLDKPAIGNCSVKIKDLLNQKTSPWTPKFLIIN
jgi:hypothetical protein